MVESSSEPGLIKRILLVDDDESFRPALQKNLEKLGYEIVSAENGKVAQGMLLRYPIDLVLSDIRMPEMDGIELTRFIKQIRPIPVILMTGFSDILETHEAHQLGADEFLPKPFERDVLSDAIERCLNPCPRKLQDQEQSYCRLGIEDFISGRQIQFNIFVQLSNEKYVKIAHQGEDLSLERMRAFRTKGVHFLYLRSEDFRKYVGFNLSLTKAIQGNKKVSKDKKLNLLRHTGEVLLERLKKDGLDQEIFDGAATFVKTTVEVLSEDPGVFDLLQVLNSHTDYHYAHGVGVSFYGVMIARSVDWHLPTNKFKVAMSGLLHDIGEKEIQADLLMRPRGTWSIADVKVYESHPLRGVDILNQIKSIPSDVVQVVKEHHEDCLSQGFPTRLRKSLVHPMAKLIAVADAFCERVIKNPNSPGMPPREALQQMTVFCSDRLEPQFFQALMRLFNFTPPGPSR